MVRVKREEVYAQFSNRKQWSVMLFFTNVAPVTYAPGANGERPPSMTSEIVLPCPNRRAGSCQRRGGVGYNESFFRLAPQPTPPLKCFHFTLAETANTAIPAPRESSASWVALVLQQRDVIGFPDSGPPSAIFFHGGMCTHPGNSE